MKKYRSIYKLYLKVFFVAVCTLVTGANKAQPVMHSHNDYTHALPFWDAWNNRAGVIEADVYCINNVLMVAHDKKDIRPDKTLDKMYIQPIMQLFNSNKIDSTRRFYLMIDIKENAAKALDVLLGLLQQYPSAFNHEVNSNAVQVFISGERPPDTSFHHYPPYIMFDGLPAKKYTPEDLHKIVMISDNFRSYSNWNGVGVLPVEDSLAISAVIKEAHTEGKPVRLWGTPDTEACWLTLIHLNADVINTDRVKECRAFLNSIKR
jgi:alkaline phosphatase